MEHVYPVYIYGKMWAVPVLVRSSSQGIKYNERKDLRVFSKKTEQSGRAKKWGSTSSAKAGDFQRVARCVYCVTLCIYHLRFTLLNNTNWYRILDSASKRYSRHLHKALSTWICMLRFILFALVLMPSTYPCHCCMFYSGVCYLPILLLYVLQ